MIKRVLIVSLMGVSLAGCVNNDSLSGDVYTASEAKQVQNVTYGTIVHVRPVQIQGGDDANVIGAIGGALVVFAVPLFDKFKIDDPVGALSVHLVNGIWGTIAVALFADFSLLTQLKGIAITALFVFSLSSCQVKSPPFRRA